MTSIGRRYTGGNVLSRAILITQPLSANQQPTLRPESRRDGKHTEARRLKNQKDDTPPGGKPHRPTRRTRRRPSARHTHQVGSLLPPPSFLPYTVRYRQTAGLTDRRTKAAIARGFHLFPFRTEKLNPAAPMVLRKWESR